LRHIGNELIFRELVHGQVSEAGRRDLRRVIEWLRVERGCDAVVLGCTELPLAVDPETSPLPTLDSTRLLARAAVRYAVAP
jgi:aspartate/glutamate racemase